MFRETVRPVSDEEREMARERIRQAREMFRGEIRKGLSIGVVCLIAGIVFWIWIAIKLDTTVASVMFGLAAAYLLGWAAYEYYVRRREFVQFRFGCNRFIERDEVLDRTLSTDRVGMVGFEVMGGPVEHAGLFYEVEAGKLFFWYAIWDHLAEKPEYPRANLTMVLNLDQTEVFYAWSTGELLKPVGVDEFSLRDLRQGTLFPGNLETLANDVAKWRRGEGRLNNP